MIPFSKPYLIGNEEEYLLEALHSGHLQGDGILTERCEQLLAEKTASTRHLLTHSCTAALEMAAILLELAPGDEVIMPSYTFVSTANAFVLHGGTPVFVDIQSENQNLDCEAVEAAITSKTRALVAVNYGGMCANLLLLRKICDDHGLVFIEDAAQSIGAKFEGKPMGSFGDLATFSFHATKNITCGEGGSLAINNRRYLERAEIIREKGTNRSQFMEGAVDKYTWVDRGSSFLPSEVNAAILLAQLEGENKITKMRLAAWREYAEGVEGLVAGGELRRMMIPTACEHNAHMFFLLLNSLEQRNLLLGHLKGRGIGAAFHYVPLHSSPAGKKLARISGSMVNTDSTFETLLRLPMYPGVPTKEVLIAIQEFFQ